MATLISQAEYARRRGVTRAAITKAIRSGRISAIDGRIDPEVADIQWARNTNPARSSVPPAPAIAAAPAGAQDGAADDPPRLLDVRARREAALADLAELELAEKRGELVPVADVEKALASKILGVRESLDTLADRLAPLMAAENDPAKVYAMLRTEIRQVLAQLATESRAPAGVQ